jgi:signal transduction histidine kinase
VPDWSSFNKAGTDTIFTDQHLLEQVIYNLVLNAIDACNKTGQIEIQLKTSSEEFTLQIVDNGSGMPFTPDPSAMSAPTTKRFGTGLGIPFAFKVCDALGGSLQYNIRPGGGTAITIKLPKIIELN